MVPIQQSLTHSTHSAPQKHEKRSKETIKLTNTEQTRAFRDVIFNKTLSNTCQTQVIENDITLKQLPSHPPLIPKKGTQGNMQKQTSKRNHQLDLHEERHTEYENKHSHIQQPHNYIYIYLKGKPGKKGLLMIPLSTGGIKPPGSMPC